MRRTRRLAGVLAAAWIVTACEYVVMPPDDRPGGGEGAEARGWSAVATAIEPGGDGTQIDLTIRNDTGDWSAMHAIEDSAVLTSGDGGSMACDASFVGTGGHRLAPGMQMRGYVAGPKSEPTVELIRVECPGAAPSAGARLAFDYAYATGEYNYYDPDASTAQGTLEIELDQVATDLSYPVAEPIDGLIQPPTVEITAINDVQLTMAGVERSDTGLAFEWETSNPGEYPSYVHIGLPPVIGADGILYGVYESPDLESVPVTPAGETAEWATETAVPADVDGLYVLLSVESKKQRLFVNYAIDITDS
jgi:hypothetical protein